MTAAGRFDAPLAADEARLRILATTDLHMNILPYDYRADRPASRPGLALVAHAVARLRARTPDLLLLDNGDFLQGSPMGDFYGQDRGLDEGEVHPMIGAMNALGFDAAALGNHEFSYGLEFLERALRDARFPVVSANLLTRRGACPGGDVPLVKPWTMIARALPCGERGRVPLLVGVLGLAPPQTVDWEREALRGRVAARDMVEAARHWVPRLRDAGADLVIALAHTGIAERDCAACNSENAARALARVPGIDALVLGHTHQVFPSVGFGPVAGVDGRAGLIAGIPAVMGGHSGSHLGVLDLRLQNDGAAGWRVARARARTLRLGAPPPGRRTDRAATAPIQRFAIQAHAKTLSHLRRRIGETRTPVHSFFSALCATPAQTLLAQAKRAWFAAQPQAAALADLPVLAVAPPFSAGGIAGPRNYCDIRPGPLVQSHAHELHPFPNKLTAFILTGAEIAEWLEAVARLYDAPVAGQAPPMLLPGHVPPYNFDMIDGLSYSFDLSTSPRLHDLRHRGRRVAPQDRFAVVTNTYRAGSALLSGLPADRQIPVAREPARHALVRYLETRSVIGPLDDGGGSWHLRATSGARALYDTSPDAMPHLAALARYRPEVLGRTPEGFLRLRLNF